MPTFGRPYDEEEELDPYAPYSGPQIDLGDFEDFDERNKYAQGHNEIQAENQRLLEEFRASGVLPSAGVQDAPPQDAPVMVEGQQPPATTAPNPLTTTGTTQPTQFAPPPPPPPAPPPPPVAGPAPTPGTAPLTTAPAPAPGAPPGLTTDLEAYAKEWMSNPNRYMSDLVTQTRDVGQAGLERQREEAVRGIDEWASSRGLLGSSLEGEQRIRLEDQLAQGANSLERDILQMLSDAESRDRLAAGGFGLDVAGYQSADELERAKLAQAESQFGRGLEHEYRMQTDLLSQREAEFARSFGMDEREFLQKQDEFTKTHGEQILTRLQQDDQFSKTLAAEDARFSIDAGLRGRALDYQKEGMDMDESFRRAALDQEKELRQDALRIQELGINKEDAYRYAALSQDAGFRQRALDLESEGMGLDEAYRRADLEYRQKASERQDESARMAILVQALNAAGNLGGLSGESAKQLMDLILGGRLDMPAIGGDDENAGTKTSVPSDSSEEETTGYGPNGDMTYQEWIDRYYNGQE